MKRKEELKGLLSTAEYCVDEDNENGLRTVLENIHKILEESSETSTDKVICSDCEKEIDSSVVESGLCPKCYQEFIWDVNKDIKSMRRRK